jgi:hypothetical protein
MKKALEQVKQDLIKLRAILPLNDHRSKGLVKRVNRAIAAIMKEETAESRAEVFW